jgi:hypothetical protein
MNRMTMIVLLLGLIGGPMSAQPLTVNPLPATVSSYVSVIAPDTDEFSRVLPTLVSSEVAAGFAPAFPYSVLVKNVSNEELRGVSVVFWEAGENGLKHRQSYLAIMLDPTKHHPKKPGEHWLFMASGALNFSAQAGNGALSPGVSVSSIVAELERSPLVVSIEWVMNAKGEIFGPDSFNTAAKLQAEQRGRAALVKSLTGSADPKAALLAAAAIQPGPRNSLFDRDHYNEQIRRDARLLLDGLNAGTVDAVRTYVTKVNREIVITKP